MSVDTLDRIERIHKAIEAQGRVRVNDWANELPVSEMTIRRDLDNLAEQDPRDERRATLRPAVSVI
jgi:DeoR/GlpR family transcriptional regulator of sugar metabolism